MNRPTPEWLASQAADCDAQAGTSPLMREVWFAGQWLGHVLGERGTDDRVAYDTCFSAGRLMFFTADPWSVVDSILGDPA